MLKILTLNSKKTTITSIVFLLFCLFAVDSMAQSEKDKPEVDNPKAQDSPHLEDFNGAKEISSHTIQSPSIKPAPKHETIKSDQNVSGERKKVETTPSTMSFNIFLYIVDKFKAD